MKTYKNIDEFILEIFPEEYEKIIKQKKTPVERAIEHVDGVFAKELEEALKGKKEEKKEQKPNGH